MVQITLSPASFFSFASMGYAPAPQPGPRRPTPS